MYEDPLKEIWSKVSKEYGRHSKVWFVDEEKVSRPDRSLCKEPFQTVSQKLPVHLQPMCFVVVALVQHTSQLPDDCFHNIDTPSNYSLVIALKYLT